MGMKIMIMDYDYGLSINLNGVVLSSLIILEVLSKVIVLDKP